jgi:hypothetical protein
MQGAGKFIVRGDALSGGAVGIAAPGQIRTGKIGVGLPILGVDQRQDARTVAAWLTAKEPVAGTLGGHRLS